MLCAGISPGCAADGADMAGLMPAVPAAPSVSAFAQPTFPSLRAHPLAAYSACHESLLGASLVLPSDASDYGNVDCVEDMHFAFGGSTPKAQALGNARTDAARVAEQSPDASTASHASDASAGGMAPVARAPEAQLPVLPEHAKLVFIVTDEPVADRWARVRQRLVHASPTAAALAESPRPDGAREAPAAAQGLSMFEANAQMTPQAAPNALMASNGVGASRSMRALTF